MIQKIIAISGKQRAGKDTVAKIIIQGDPSWFRRGFADILKLELFNQRYPHEALVTTPDCKIDYIESTKNDPEIRTALIELGQQKRAMGSGYLVDMLLDNTNHEKVVIPDLRFMDEIKRLQERCKEVTLIRVNAPTDIRGGRGTLSNEDDPTETSLDGFIDWDFVINNNYNNYSMLRRQVLKLCGML